MRRKRGLDEGSKGGEVLFRGGDDVEMVGLICLRTEVGKSVDERIAGWKRKKMFRSFTKDSQSSVGGVVYWMT